MTTNPDEFTSRRLGKSATSLCRKVAVLHEIKLAEMFQSRYEATGEKIDGDLLDACDSVVIAWPGRGRVGGLCYLASEGVKPLVDWVRLAETDADASEFCHAALRFADEFKPSDGECVLLFDLSRRLLLVGRLTEHEFIEVARITARGNAN